MKSPTEMAERHARMLAEFAEIALAAARELGEALSQAETPDEKAVVMTALHRAGRALRQSVALEARLVRDAGRDVRESETEARQARDRQVKRRKDQLQATLKRLLWNERESEEAERLEPVLEELIEEDASFEAFLTEPLELQVARLAEQLGIPTAHPREGGDPSGLSGESSGDDLDFDAAPPPDTG